jgi:hypothetical protein
LVLPECRFCIIIGISEFIQLLLVEGGIELGNL